MTKSCGPWIGLLPGHVACRRKRPWDRMPAGCWAVLIFLLLVTSRVRAQDIFSTSTVNASPYQDEFSRNCEPSNSANPYAGMDPLSCHGVMAPVDSRNQCSLRGMTLLQKWGNTCYYCQPINPPINGIILPLDQIAKAGRQGYRCGCCKYAGILKRCGYQHHYLYLYRCYRCILIQQPCSRYVQCVS